jgi:hypothetical protein
MSDTPAQPRKTVDVFLPGVLTSVFQEAESTGNPDGYRIGAGDETRTRDIFLGKEVLYQLSYTRF